MQPAHAQSFPSKPLRLVVPTGPGGGYDFIARQLADRLPSEVGQPVVVENRAGAAGQIGSVAVAGAPADGHTLLVGGLGNMTWVPALYKNVQYDALADFAPVAIVAAFPFVLVSRSELPHATLQDIVRFGRANPGRLTIANPGPGTGQHISAAMLQHLAGMALVHVSYKSAQQAYPDLLSGRVDLFFDNVATIRPHIESGRVKAFAVSSVERSRLLPNVPTAREAGLPGYEVESWIGLFAPAKTPRPAVEQLRTAVGRAMGSAEMRGRLQAAGWRVFALSAAQTDGFLKAEADRWPPLLREAGVKVE
jgi:tripartite-type tricarboxylate transporter receptor subunit TctC